MLVSSASGEQEGEECAVICVPLPTMLMLLMRKQLPRMTLIFHIWERQTAQFAAKLTPQKRGNLAKILLMKSSFRHPPTISRDPLLSPRGFWNGQVTIPWLTY